MPAAPTVSVIVPVLDERQHLERCLEAIAAQDYEQVIEVIVADGGSIDSSREFAAGFAKVRVVDNPRRIRPAGLNAAIAAARGDVLVRVDARTAISPGYVRGCVEALGRSGAAMVGGPMRFAPGTTPGERGIIAAMTSRLGAGPAAFRREGGEGRFVDTVYLGAYRREVIEQLGGYDEWSGGNEDAELAFRAHEAGGVYLDPALETRYVVREGLGPLYTQFRRYGRNRALTIRKHPGSLSPRQLAVPALFVGLASPWRRRVLAAYAAALLGRAALEATGDPAAAPTLLGALATMHFAWGVGFVEGMTEPRSRRQPPPPST